GDTPVQRKPSSSVPLRSTKLKKKISVSAVRPSSSAGATPRWPTKRPKHLRSLPPDTAMEIDAFFGVPSAVSKKRAAEKSLRAECKAGKLAKLSEANADVAAAVTTSGFPRRREVIRLKRSLTSLGLRKKGRRDASMEDVSLSPRSVDAIPMLVKRGSIVG